LLCCFGVRLVGLVVVHAVRIEVASATGMRVNWKNVGWKRWKRWKPMPLFSKPIPLIKKRQSEKNRLPLISFGLVLFRVKRFDLKK